MIEKEPGVRLKRPSPVLRGCVTLDNTGFMLWILAFLCTETSSAHRGYNLGQYLQAAYPRMPVVQDSGPQYTLPVAADPWGAVPG